MVSPQSLLRSTDPPVPRESTALSPRLDSLLAFAAHRGRAIWVLVIVTMVLDIALTSYGLGVGLREGNPIARAMILEFGIYGMVGLKAFSLGVGGMFWSVLPSKQAAIVPVCLALTGSVVVAINVVVIHVSV